MKGKRKVKPGPWLHAHQAGGSKTSEAWWYEDRRGIDIYVHRHGQGIVERVRIPWVRLLRAAERCAVTVAGKRKGER